MFFKMLKNDLKAQKGLNIILFYVAKKTAERLGGDLFMKSWKAEEETEVTLILPL